MELTQNRFKSVRAPRATKEPVPGSGGRERSELGGSWN
jgi:hypothetical protein